MDANHQRQLGRDPDIQLMWLVENWTNFFLFWCARCRGVPGQAGRHHPRPRGQCLPCCGQNVPKNGFSGLPALEVSLPSAQELLAMSPPPPGGVDLASYPACSLHYANLYSLPFVKRMAEELENTDNYL